MKHGTELRFAVPGPSESNGADVAGRNPEFSPLSPYIVEVEVNCEECGGSGYDPGGIDPWGPELCPTCHGAKTQWATRNYLGEALRIAANPDCHLQVERTHLIAIVQYCRQTVSAIVRLPEVPQFAQRQAQHKRSSRHRRDRLQSHKVTQR